MHFQTPFKIKNLLSKEKPAFKISKTEIFQVSYKDCCFAKYLLGFLKRFLFSEKINVFLKNFVVFEKYIDVTL